MIAIQTTQLGTHGFRFAVFPFKKRIIPLLATVRIPSEFTPLIPEKAGSRMQARPTLMRGSYDRTGAKYVAIETNPTFWETKPGDKS